MAAPAIEARKTSDRGYASIRKRECATAPNPPAAPGAPMHRAKAKPAHAGAGD
jgi:hypothetical protein